MAATPPSCSVSSSCILPPRGLAVSPSTANSILFQGRAGARVSPMHGNPRLTPEILLRAYAEGLFPMAERRGDPTLYWVSPEKRGIIPLEHFHVPHRLARTVRSGQFAVTADSAFREVMLACAAPAPGREETWINDE